MDTISEIQSDIAALRIMATVTAVHAAAASGDTSKAFADQRAACLRSVDAFNINADDPEAIKGRMRETINQAFDGVNL